MRPVRTIGPQDSGSRGLAGKAAASPSAALPASVRAAAITCRSDKPSALADTNTGVLAQGEGTTMRGRVQPLSEESASPALNKPNNTTTRDKGDYRA